MAPLCKFFRLVILLLGLVCLLCGCTKNQSPQGQYYELTGTSIDLTGTKYPKEFVFQPGQDCGIGGGRRIPTTIISNKGTVLCVCEDRTFLGDEAVIGIILARKGVNDADWKYNYVLPYSSMGYGKVMNPSFIIDRDGSHGYPGRIYLFFLSMIISKENHGLAMYADTDEVDCMYICSDDDGQTWTDCPVSLKKGWNLSAYRWMAVSPANGIQMRNGLLVLPAMCQTWDYEWKSGIIYKESSSSCWVFSHMTTDSGNNESTVFEGNEPGTIRLNVRNENSPLRKTYSFSLDKKVWTMDSYFDAKIICQASVQKVDNGYLMSMNDPVSTPYIRERLTVWKSDDGDSWKRHIRLSNNETYGYSVVNSFGGKTVIVWEDGGIMFADISKYCK